MERFRIPGIDWALREGRSRKWCNGRKYVAALAFDFV
jgi:hypothetical protein